MPYKITSSILVFIYFLILLNTSYSMLLVYMFFYGLVSSGRLISYPYLFEFLMPKYRTYALAFLLMFDASFYITGSLYFRYISKEWVYYQYYGLVLSILALVGLYYVPETPKFLYSMKKYDEAREVLKYMAKVNKHIIAKEYKEFIYDNEV